MVICTFPRDVSVFRSRLFSLSFFYLTTRESSGIRRHLTVIRSFVIPRPQVRRRAETNVVICTLLEDVSVFCPKPFSLTICYPAAQESGGIQRHLTAICISSFGDPKSDETKRLMWSSAPFPELAASSDRDYFSLTFCYPVTQEFGCMHRHLTVIRTTKFGDPKSDETWRPMWSSAPFTEMSASSGRDNFCLTILLSSDPRVRWNAETPYGY